MRSSDYIDFKFVIPSLLLRHSKTRLTEITSNAVLVHNSGHSAEIIINTVIHTTSKCYVLPFYYLPHLLPWLLMSSLVRFVYLKCFFSSLVTSPWYLGLREAFLRTHEEVQPSFRVWRRVRKENSNLRRYGRPG